MTNNFEKSLNILTEKTLSQSEIAGMLDKIIDRTDSAKSGSGKEINDMAKDMKKNKSLSPAQVGWAMKTLKSLS